MQGAGQLVVYMENTRRGSHLLLRLPEKMVGEFLDENGARLAEAAVSADQGSERPTVLMVPPGHDGVLLVLGSEMSDQVSPDGPGSR